jgi:transketolase
VRNTFAKAFYEIARQDPRLYLVVADISPVASAEAFQKEHPERFINVGVAEQVMTGVAAGLALRGCIPFTYTISTFTIYRPFEMVRVDCCYQNLPVKMVGIGGGVTYSTLGGTHHTQEDIAIMSALPNLTILAPCDPAETIAATRAAVEIPGPVYLRLGKAGEPDLTANAPDAFAAGKVRFIKQGRDMCLLSYGPITKMAVDIAARLESEKNLSVAVVSVHTLKPLDHSGIASILAKFPAVGVIEEHSCIGGLAAQVKQIAWDSQARCRLKTYSLKDEFIHFYGSQRELWAEHGLREDRIFSELAALQHAAPHGTP